MVSKKIIKSTLILLFFIINFHNIVEAKINFGITQAVKNKAKQLKNKIQSPASGVKYTLSPNTIILTQQTDSYLVSQDTNTGTYYYSTQATQIADLKPNNIIISTKGEGFLRKIESINLINNQYEVKTKPAALNEAFENLYINIHKTITPSETNIYSLKAYEEGKIKPSDSKGFVINVNPVLYDKDGNLDTTNDQVRTFLNFSFSVDVDVIIDMPDPLHLNKVYFRVDIEKIINNDFSATIGASISKEYNLLPKPITAVIIPIPPVTFNIEPKLKAEASLSSGFDINTTYKEHFWSEIKCDNNCTDGNNWRISGDVTNEAKLTDISQGGELTVKIGPDLEVNIKILDILGPYFETFLGGKFNVEATTHLPYTISTILQSVVGLKAEIKRFGFNWQLFQIEKELLNLEYPFITGILVNHVPEISSFTVTPQIVNPGGQVTIQCNATDPDGDNLTYNWTATNGILSSTTTNPVVWTAPSLTGTYVIDVSVRDNYNGSIQGSTSVVVAVPTNNAPTISWTGETNYTNDGLNPETGDTSTAFTYRIKYTDADNDAPQSGYPKVHIKKGGVEITGSPFTMTYVSGNYNTGAIYTYSRTLSSGTDYTYYFEAKDSKGTDATGTPTTPIDAPDVSQGASNHQLPDTGQIGDYTTIFGEDSDYQPVLSQPNYTDNGDGTITDNRTGLMWKKCSSGNLICGTSALGNPWEEAIFYCETLNFAGYDDWRLPNIRELESIINYNTLPSINNVYFPNTWGPYWTSTTDVSDNTYAFSISFDDGTINTRNKNDILLMRCVRGP